MPTANIPWANAAALVSSLGFKLTAIEGTDAWNQEVMDNLICAASTDAMTGLCNRVRGEQVMQDVLGQEGGALIAIDIDHFKSINDTYGHGVGDLVIKEVAHAINRIATEVNGVAARMGGEEFAVVLQDATLLDAYFVAERIRIAVSYIMLTMTISVSIGISETHEHVSPADWWNRADKCLYRAKNNGRNVTMM